MEERADIVILGGGPAGSALALALARAGASVALLERSGYEAFRVGETVPPTFGALLAELGVEEDFQRGGHLRAHGTCAAWGGEEPGYHDFLSSGQGPGWHLERTGFDRMLAEAAGRRGVRVHTRSVLAACERGPGAGWRLRVRGEDGGERVLAAPLVADATGRLAVFATARGAAKICFDEQVVVSAVFSHAPPVPQEGLVLVEAAPSGWWYHAALPGHRSIAAFMSDADLVRAERLGGAEEWGRLLERTRHVWPRLARATRCSEPRVHSARTQCLERMHGEGWLAVGDAACTFDPLSSGGISQALRSALAAASALQEHAAGRAGALEAYEQRMRLEFEAHLRARRRYYALEGRWRGSAFWQRRNGSLTLSPWEELRLVETPEARHALERGAMYLPPGEVRRLCLECRSSRPAHQLVRDFLAGARGPVSELRVIEALQHLVGRGVLERSIQNSR